MTKDEVVKLLESQKNEKGMDHWERLYQGPLSSYGLGVTQLKKLAKKIGKDHKLAQLLWDVPNYDIKTLATIIDNPKEVTPQQVDHQIQGADFWLLSHSYCSNLLAKTPFVKDQAEQWMLSKNDLQRRCGYLLLYHIAKDNKALEDSYFQPILDTIEKFLPSEENFVKDAMNNALLMIGQRSKGLNKRALEVAKNIGQVEVDYGDNSCQPIDCVKHLSSERIQQKFA
jgi:3-methyladenine DNA glycosylase AlkD